MVKQNMHKLIAAVLFIGAIVLVYFAFLSQVHPPIKQVSSFLECEEAGYLVMESYPRQCRTPEGKNFTEVIPERVSEKITYTNASSSLITVELPYPGAVVGKDFSVIGKARGMWFFEASFLVEVLDKNGKPIAQGVAQAQGEWMTENFVPFKADIKVPMSYIGPATLVLKKDNPSGIPEKDASISFPITIEY